jgi:hypothetical protein
MSQAIPVTIAQASFNCPKLSCYIDCPSQSLSNLTNLTSNSLTLDNLSAFQPFTLKFGNSQRHPQGSTGSLTELTSSHCPSLSIRLIRPFLSTSITTTNSSSFGHRESNFFHGPTGSASLTQAGGGGGGGILIDPPLNPNSLIAASYGIASLFTSCSHLPSVTLPVAISIDFGISVQSLKPGMTPGKYMMSEEWELNAVWRSKTLVFQCEMVCVLSQRVRDS